MVVPTKPGMSATLIGVDGSRVDCKAEFFTSAQMIMIRDKSIPKGSVIEVVMEGKHYQVRDIVNEKLNSQIFFERS